MDHAKAFLYLARAVYGYMVSDAVASIADPTTGSLVYPREDWSRLDSLFIIIFYSIISAFLYKYVRSVSGRRSQVDHVILACAVMFGIWCWAP